MNRRAFLSRLATASAATTLGLQSADVLAADSWFTAYHNAAEQAPWLLAYRSVERESFAAEVTVEGRWPKSLNGVLYRNGPAQHDIGEYRYRHWFDGDGLVQRFEVTEGKLRHAGQMVQTAKRRRERSLGRAALPAFGSSPPDGVGVARADDLNPANISMLWHHQRLLALWEAGSPHEIVPADLSTVGLHHFSQETAGLPFSAHPKVEPDGTLWNFGYASGSGRIVLWHLNRRGEVENLKALSVGPTGMPHDFVVTERYIVLLLAPVHRREGEATRRGFLGLHRWHPDLPSRVLVVDKNRLELVRELELPAQWVFHFGNGFDDGNNVIRFDAARHGNPDVMFNTLSDVMRGRWTPSEHARWFEYTLDLNTGRASETLVLGPSLGVEFPTVHGSEVGRPHERVVMLSGDASRASRPGDLNQVSCWNRTADRLDTYRYPADHMVEEHLLVGDPAAKDGGQGWIVGTALDCANQATRLSVFAADRLADGPLAQATLPYALPLGLHGTFVPKPSSG
ncbi:MAG: carotenoid oxygenase family protein [Pseudomonadota bacterium]